RRSSDLLMLAALAAGLHARIADPHPAKDVPLGQLAAQFRRQPYVMATADGSWPGDRKSRVE
ncbi:hypothetical protein, partial [Methylobacterium radiotolerans]|uniref:hypothetical protein n=1 Tax=Methylobacterium radiotolerans TaxID=31998 RepID=UPI000B91FF5D